MHSFLTTWGAGLFRHTLLALTSSPACAAASGYRSWRRALLSELGPPSVWSQSSSAAFGKAVSVSEGPAAYLLRSRSLAEGMFLKWFYCATKLNSNLLRLESSKVQVKLGFSIYEIVFHCPRQLKICRSPLSFL